MSTKGRKSRRSKRKNSRSIDDDATFHSLVIFYFGSLFTDSAAQLKSESVRAFYELLLHTADERVQLLRVAGQRG